ncbi:MAG: exodeoxyribonuclease I [Chromatocurvus sp.]
MPNETFYWHDYETFGTDPMRDRPVQFAGQRTDADFNPVGEPLVIYARPAEDYLPQPGACLVTGITPQLALEEGVPECEFIARIHDELAAPGTCGVGYNSLRFDDEVTRHTLYRNLFDPYAREWKNGNSRWDIIDALRAAYALRPEGIEWPLREDGLPSFRLEELTAANGIAHAEAHDALSDVTATIAVARLLRDRQPKLYEYMLGLRRKPAATAMLDVRAMKPVLHVSGMFGAARHNIGLIVPLMAHPGNRNEVICYDLDADPRDLIEMDADTLRARLYSRGEDLPEGAQRPGLKSVHVNRSPVLVTARMADAHTAARLGLDGERCRRHLAQLRRWRETDAGGFDEKLAAIHAPRDWPQDSDPDTQLYGGGFFSDSDRRVMDSLRRLPPDSLAAAAPVFEDTRLPEMFFRYRARNYPDTLDDADRERWDEFRLHRLSGEAPGFPCGLEAYQADLAERLQALSPGSPSRQVIEALQAWGDTLLA